jgi:uncharacterized membrane protein
MALRSTWAGRFRVRQYVKGSLWLLPLLGALVGAALGAADGVVEGHLTLPAEWTYSASTASGVLTAIVAAMVALIGFVVTIGVLVVQTATGTLSPRFMRIWYRDRLQKVVLATFAGTLTFSFALLRHIGSPDVPNLGVTLAGLLVTVSLVLLLLYLDRFTHALRPVAVGTLVARAGLRVVAESPQAPQDTRARRGAVFDHLSGSGTAVRAPVSGVVQAVHTRGLTAIGQRHDCVVVLARSPGDFVAAGAVMMEVYGGTDLPAERVLTGLVAIGRERTIDQDAAFALRIVVDIAIRALSPAVNDPTTAVQMIDQVEAFLRGVAAAGARGATWDLVDDSGARRVVMPARTFESYLRLGLSEIVAYGANAIQVCRRLAALFESVAEVVDPADRSALDAARTRFEAAVAGAFPDPRAREFAGTPDRQGIGGPAWLPEPVPAGRGAGR